MHTHTHNTHTHTHTHTQALAAAEQYVLQMQARLRDGVTTKELDLTHLRLRLIPGYECMRP